MKNIRVVAAVIKAENEEGQPIIFATQRGYGEYKDGWECYPRQGILKMGFHANNGIILQF